MSYLERYKQGEYTHIWQELYTFGDSLVASSKRNDAIAVAEETMKRVKHNIEILHQRLLDFDYRFVEPEQAHIPAKEADAEKIEHLSQLVGGLPLSLKAWFKIVGQVDFRGSHPDLASYYPDNRNKNYYPHTNATTFPYYSDPLWFEGLDSFIEEAEFVAENSNTSNSQQWNLIPDWFHKANVSGSTYYFDLPRKAMDTELRCEPHETTFVNYLRISFQWGGFPGFHLHSDDKFEDWHKKWHLQKEYKIKLFHIAYSKNYQRGYCQYKVKERGMNLALSIFFS